MQYERSTNKGLFHPIWFLVAVTLPQLCLIGFQYYIYVLIRSQLRSEARLLWYVFGAVSLLLLVAYTAYAVYLWHQKQQISPKVALFLFGTYLPAAYLWWLNLRTMIPWSIPQWMLDRDDSPWYPTMRLFRQTRPGNWDNVIQRVASILKSIASQTNEQEKVRKEL